MSRSRGSLDKLKRSTRFRTRQNFCLLFLSSILLSILITTLQLEWENCLFYCHSQHFIAGRLLAAKICKFFLIDAVFHGESFPGFWILQARISQILESGYPYIGRRIFIEQWETYFSSNVRF